VGVCTRECYYKRNYEDLTFVHILKCE